MLCVDALLGSLASDGFDTAHAGGHTAFANDAEQTDASGALGMATTAKFYAAAKLYHAHLVAILFAKQGDGTKFLGLLHGYVAVVLQWNVLAYAAIDNALHLA